MTQKQIILKYLEYVGEPVPAYKLRSVSTPFGFLGHQADRVCRKLAQEGYITRVQMGKYAGYLTKSDKRYKEVKVEGTNEVRKILI